MLKEAVKNKPLLGKVKLDIWLFEYSLEVFKGRSSGRSDIPKPEEKRRGFLLVSLDVHDTEQVNVVFTGHAGLFGYHACVDLYREHICRAID